ncbi:MAG: hypothetical protein ACHQWV_03120 [Nitrospirales bacterium]
MATRKTIRVNPLDTLVPAPVTNRTGRSPAAAKTRSAGPTSVIVQTSTSQNQSKAKDSHIPALATQIAQPPSPADLSSRIQSLEEKNEYMMWLVGGAILLAVLL